MSIVVKLTFPAGRYHATPWGRHVNEGVAEWPPSPWRLLRALIAVWKRTCPELAESDVRSVLEHLLQPPQFFLPPHRTAHTRHYMPWEKKGPADRTLVFDTFVSLDRSEAVYLKWSEAGLASEDREHLQRLLNNLSSLGRAESWVQAELAEEADIVGEPCGVATEDTTDPVSLFCPDPQSAFADEHYPTHDAQKIAQGKIKPSEFLFDCPRWHLCLDTETIHAKRWPTVPGSRMVSFTRPSGRSVRIVRKQTKSVSRQSPTVATFMLDGPVLPLTTSTLQVAEKFRMALMSCFESWCRRHPNLSLSFLRPDSERFSSPTLSGKELSGEIRKGHRHAYYLPTSESSDPNHITNITLTAAEGFGPAELDALTSIRELNLGDLKLRVQLVGLGNAEMFDSPIMNKATTWESVTPFVAHRHYKSRGTKRDLIDTEITDWRSEFLLISARECLERRYGQIRFKIEVINDTHKNSRAIHFRRFRSNRSAAGDGRAFGFLRIQFEQPQAGPICLGFECHFGLGLFSAK
jgi:CRISPR-associated protein Csb2